MSKMSVTLLQNAGLPRRAAHHSTSLRWIAALNDERQAKEAEGTPHSYKDGRPMQWDGSLGSWVKAPPAEEPPEPERAGKGGVS